MLLIKLVKTGQRLSLQAMQLRLSENTIGGGIYQSHIANKGWETNWAQNGTISGTTDKLSLRQSASI